MNTIRRYENLKNRIKERKEQFDNFIEMLEEKTSWMTSPASTRFHLNIEGGLLNHSIGVTETLLKLRREFAHEISEESCIIVGLFHDVGKVGVPGIPLYLPNDRKWEVNKGIKFRHNPEIVTMGLAVRSLYLVNKYIPLSATESQAIIYHDGQYIDDNKIVANKEEPLTLLLHWADYWTSYILEEGREIKEDNRY